MTIRATKVAYDAKTKRYMYYNNKAVNAGEPIRLDIPDLFLYKMVKLFSFT